jgi:site-specific DNA-methyltransferase (adenine-specific)/site-specific DNA-methyltransferase (cytosine-N4-specific)
MTPKTFRKIPEDADLSHIHPDLRDKAVPVSALSKHPDNPQIHPEANKKAIAGSLKRYLQRKPIVVNLTASGLRIEAGHGVYEQMVQAGSDYVAVTIVEDDPVTEFGYMIADNRTSELSETDPERLAPILRQLIEAGEEVEEIGWDDEAVTALLGDPDEEGEDGSNDEEKTVQTDRAAELQKEWDTALGQIWEIPSKTVPGKCHRVMCGDCRNADDVARLMDGQEVNVAFTSPPYASQRKYDEESGFKPIKPDAYVGWFEAVQANVREHLAIDGSWFVNIKEHCEDGQRHLYVKDLTIAHVRAWGWRFVDELCWARSAVPMQITNAIRFKNEWEPVFQFSLAEKPKIRHDNVKGESLEVPDRHTKRGMNKTGAFQNNFYHEGAYPSNLLWIDNGASGTAAPDHPATFPWQLAAHFIKAYSDPLDHIFDPFLGSGTTMIAAEREGRICAGMEISPKYMGVILQRCKNAGLEPRLAAD